MGSWDYTKASNVITYNYKIELIAIDCGAQWAVNVIFDKWLCAIFCILPILTVNPF